MVTQEDIQRAAETIATTASSPATVILFGSHANGTAGQHSDVDFLVIEDQVADQLKEYGRLRRAILWSLDAAVDILVVSRPHAEAWKDVRGSVIHEAYTRGRVLAGG
jgi:predicted nucleotidyltransferase